ncbi:HlyD family secretion protein [Rhizobium rhododendri]|uniref:HlyD family secretion protein n=1 Tax=Rhizobium rhododendri TaxID=2506430 RepID=UPI00115E4B2F
MDGRIGIFKCVLISSKRRCYPGRRVKPIDIDNVKSGLKAEVRFSSFSSRTTPAVFGKVTVLSQDVIEARQTRRRITKPVSRSTIRMSHRKFAAGLLPGMPPVVIISTDERTFAQYIVSQRQTRSTKSMREQ